MSNSLQFSSVQSLSRVRFFVTPWTAARQASLSINSQSLSKLMSIELVIPSNHLILCHPLLLLPSTFPSIRGFSNESVLLIRWSKYWSFIFSITPYNKYSGNKRGEQRTEEHIHINTLNQFLTEVQKHFIGFQQTMLK